MPDDTAGTEHQSPATPEPRRKPTIWDPEVERLERPSAGCSSQRAVWVASRTPAGPAWPCSRSATRYRKGSLPFRIALGSPTDEDLRTGIEGAEYKVAVEIDDVGTDARDGWFVFIQGAAHRLDSGHDRVSAGPPGGQPPAGSARENFVRVTPTFIAGRRLRRH